MGGWYLPMMLVIWFVVAALGLVVAGYAYLAWRRERSRPLFALTIGLLLTSVGPAVAWLWVYGFADNLYLASVGCAGFLVGGFACLLVSIRVRAT